MIPLSEFYVCRDQLAEVDLLLRVRERTHLRGTDNSATRVAIRILHSALSRHLHHAPENLLEAVSLSGTRMSIVYRRVYYHLGAELPYGVQEFTINRATGRVQVTSEGLETQA